MRKKIISNIISSGVEKIFILGVQFLASLLLIRILPRDQYGIIGVVSGYYAFLSIANISIEAIMLRDHNRFDNDINGVMHDFMIFNILKSCLFFILSFLLILLLTDIYQTSDFIYAILSTTFILTADNLTAPLAIYSASKFNQQLVTKLSVVRAFVNLALMAGVYFFPTLLYIMVKDIAVSAVFVLSWYYIAKKKMSLGISLKRQTDWSFLWNCFHTYSLWTHLNNVVTNVIYRSDTFFLSLFATLTVVGNYNVALNTANIANIAPMILGYQNSIALSNVNSKGDIFRISNSFLKVSIAIGVVTLIGFLIAGQYLIRIITGKFSDEIYFYMICIVSSVVIVKSVASPLVAYLNIHGSVKDIVTRITLPLLGFTLAIYYTAARQFQAMGLAYANIIIAVVWLCLVLKEAKRFDYQFNFSPEL